MAKIGAKEMSLTPAKENATVVVKEGAPPYAFHASGPRNVISPNWRDLINSSWQKRTVVACFKQAVDLLEIDWQENRTEENALAQNGGFPSGTS